MSLTLFRNISELYTFSGFVAKDGRRVTDADYGVIARGAILAQNGTVAWVGPEADLPNLANDPRFAHQKKDLVEHDLQGLKVMPSLTECHTHLVFAGHRADEFELRNQGVGYAEIAKRGGGILSTMQKTRDASLDQLRALAQKRVNAFLQQGVTVIESKTGYALNREGELRCLEVMRQLQGARIVPTFLGAHALPPEYATHSSYLQMLLSEILPEVKSRGLASRVDIFVEKGFFETAEARLFLLAAQKLGFEVTIHADQLSLSGGTELALDLAAVSCDHVIHVSDELIRRLGATNTTAVLLPTADLYLQCPYPPARKLIDQGVRVALASDFNPGSAPSQDVQLVGLLARLAMKMTLAEVLCAYTYNAAAALRLENQYGALTPGRMADLIAFDGDLSEHFFAAGGRLACQVFVSGRSVNLTAS